LAIIQTKSFVKYLIVQSSSYIAPEIYNTIYKTVITFYDFVAVNFISYLFIISYFIP